MPQAGSKRVASGATSPTKWRTARTTRSEVTWSDPARRTESVKRSARTLTVSAAPPLSASSRASRTTSAGSSQGRLPPSTRVFVDDVNN